MTNKRKNILVSILILFIILISLSLNVYATDEVHILPPGLDVFDIRILNNGSYVDSKVKPIETENELVLAPLRVILEDSGYQVKWNKTGVIDISKGDKEYKFDSNSSKYIYENKNGTIMIDHKYFKEIEDVKVTYDVLTRTLVVKSEYKKDDIYDYDLGKRTMRTSLDRDLTYRLNGGIVAPDTDNNPLVIVMHGSHGGTKSEENRFDLGYSYLLKELVKEGYVVMSPNVTIQYSFEDGEPIKDERLKDIFE